MCANTNSMSRLHLAVIHFFVLFKHSDTLPKRETMDEATMKPTGFDNKIIQLFAGKHGVVPMNESSRMCVCVTNTFLLSRERLVIFCFFVRMLWLLLLYWLHNADSPIGRTLCSVWFCLGSLSREIHFSTLTVSIGVASAFLPSSLYIWHFTSNDWQEIHCIRKMLPEEKKHTEFNVSVFHPMLFSAFMISQRKQARKTKTSNKVNYYTAFECGGEFERKFFLSKQIKRKNMNCTQIKRK